MSSLADPQKPKNGTRKWPFFDLKNPKFGTRLGGSFTGPLVLEVVSTFTCSDCSIVVRDCLARISALARCVIAADADGRVSLIYGFSLVSIPSRCTQDSVDMDSNHLYLYHPGYLFATYIFALVSNPSRKERRPPCLPRM